MTFQENDTPRQRLKKFAEILKEKKLGIAIISNPKHIFYLTGFSSNLNMYLTLMKGPRSTSFLAVKSDGRASILLGKSEVSNPWTKKSATELEKTYDGEVTTYVDYDARDQIITYGDTLSKRFSGWIGTFSGKDSSVGIEKWHLPDSYRSVISARLTATKLTNLSPVILSMRRTKGRDEIIYLKTATKMIDFAYSIAKLSSKPGNSELDVYREMNYHAFQNYGPFGWVIGDIISGERALGVGGWATGRVLGRGDTIVLDLQTSRNNYWSDLCRTFVVGKKTRSSQRRALNALVNSLDRAQDLMRPGTKGCEIYDAVNNEIMRSGFPKIPHHVGHSIGLDDQEPPWFIPSSQEELEEGMVCVVEPGIYTKETGGIRIEDAFVVGKKGSQRISAFPRELD